jgi:hypothetical protein
VTTDPSAGPSFTDLARRVAALPAIRRVASSPIVRRAWDHPLVAPGAVLFAVMLYLSMRLPLVGDDGVNILTYPQTDFVAWFAEQYRVWTPRWFIDPVKWAFFQSLGTYAAFRVLNAVVYVVWFVFLVKVFGFSRTKVGAWIAMLAVLIFPFRTMASAGFLTTTISYAWPIAFGLVAGYGMRKALRRQAIRWWEWIVYLALFLYAVNEEQLNVFMIGLLVVLIAYLARTQRRADGFLVTLLCVSIAQLIFVFTSPGESNRHVSEVRRVFWDFDLMTIVERVQLGFLPMGSALMANANRTMLVGVVVLCAALWLRHRFWFYRLVGLAPVAVVVWAGFSGVITLFTDLPLRWFPVGWSELLERDRMITVVNYDTMRAYVPFVVFALAFICIGLTAYLVFDDRPAWGWLAVGILFLGFLTRVAMGFTPTAFESGTRTFAFWHFSLLIVVYLVGQRIVEVRPRAVRWMLPVLAAFAAMAYLDALDGALNVNSLRWGLI